MTLFYRNVSACIEKQDHTEQDRPFISEVYPTFPGHIFAIYMYQNVTGYMTPSSIGQIVSLVFNYYQDTSHRHRHPHY